HGAVHHLERRAAEARSELALEHGRPAVLVGDARAEGLRVADDDDPHRARGLPRLDRPSPEAEIVDVRDDLALHAAAGIEVAQQLDRAGLALEADPRVLGDPDREGVALGERRPATVDAAGPELPCGEPEKGCEQSDPGPRTDPHGRAGGTGP